MSRGNWIAVASVGLTIALSAVGATWLVSSAIGDVRTELKTDIAAVRTELGSRISAVEGKLDIIIEALNI